MPLKIGGTVAAPIAGVFRLGQDRRPGLARLPEVGVDVTAVVSDERRTTLEDADETPTGSSAP